MDEGSRDEILTVPRKIILSTKINVIFSESGLGICLLINIRYKGFEWEAIQWYIILIVEFLANLGASIANRTSSSSKIWQTDVFMTPFV